MLASPGEPEGRTLSDTFADESFIDPAAKLGKEEIIEEIMACLHDLDDRELEILSLKHGFHPHGQLSFRELGRRLGVSHEWVRRIAELAVVKIRRALDGQRGMPLDQRRRLRACECRMACTRLRHGLRFRQCVDDARYRTLQPLVRVSRR